MVREGTLEERGDNVHERDGDVVLERVVRVLPVVCRVGHDPHVQEERALEQLPHVVGCVDLLHLHLRVDVAVGQEVDVGVLDLRAIEWS